MFSEHNLECKGALERTQPHLDGGALNAAAVQSFIARASLMHTRVALHGANEHSWLQWAVSRRILARRGPLDAQERGLSGGVRCAAAVSTGRESALRTLNARGFLQKVLWDPSAHRDWRYKPILASKK